MMFLLGRTVRSFEVSELLPRYIHYTALRRELLWRPHLVRAQRVDGVEIFHRLRHEGRGIIFNFAHHGHFVGVTPSFAAHGVHAHVAAAPHYFDIGPGFGGAIDRAHIRAVRENGVQTFNSVKSYEYMRDLLRGGATVGLAHDLPGRTRGTWLGREVSVASGITRLALETGAPIVPVSAAPDGLLTRFYAQEPIDPREFSDREALQAEIFRRHEPAVLAWPEAVDWPLTRCSPANPIDAEYFDLPHPKATVAT